MWLARVCSALVLFAIFFATIYIHSLTWLFAIIVVATTGLALSEYITMMRKRGYRTQSVLSYSIGLGILADGYFFRAQHTLELLLASLIISFLIQMKRQGFEKAHSTVSGTVMGQLYVVAPLAFALCILRREDFGPHLIVFMILVTWAADTGAYAVGSAIGKHKMSPVLSPNKTWEGAVGGVVFGIATALLLFCFWPGMRSKLLLAEAALLGTVFSIVGQLGDLAESALKRETGIKDSGKTYTGHGGMLDVIDSLLFVSPAFYYYLYHLYPLIERP
ncbi:MAG: phosphatidate cytidylyltransferase [bacterium]